MENLVLPKVGEIYRSQSEVRKAVGIAEGENRHPDVIFNIPERNRNYTQWLPFGQIGPGMLP